MSGSKKVQMVCSHCGSAEISADAAARWDEQAQQWEVSNVYDKGHSCDDCGCTSIDEVPLEEWEAQQNAPPPEPRKWSVILTRDTTESAVIEVMAVTEGEANSAAMRAAVPHHAWQRDDNHMPRNYYITGTEPAHA